MGITRQIVTKAVKDPEFRRRLLRDAKAALEQDFGIELSEGTVVRVHENTATTINIVLPEAELADASDVPPTDDQIQAVAGEASRRRRKPFTTSKRSSCSCNTGFWECA
jgi:hypothetical protein